MLVAGVGNVFLGDDGFGSEVARQLAGRPLPAHVRVVDYGIGGIHLAFDLLDGYDRLVLIDTISQGAPPGTVVVVEVDAERPHDAAVDAHSMDPATVMASLAALGGRMPPTLLVGCEPAEVGEGMGLSPPVAAAVETTMSAVLELIGEAVPTCGGARDATGEGA